ncbi:Type IV pili biogenesis protein PilP [Pseudomonas reidholzensis]|uniref:Type IV pili biogenesis protein PilP n=1 Tax=Pseudomonas reidholzensis TaxID=1785162 RepID=A0A383S2S3_9PSED|nr:pilus assembly protein PilP [Pseudomonas reidholzensis]SYX93006.1 Type IV pili biogenesis protein PilP [Pseudomonas reidholzensis]
MPDWQGLAERSLAFKVAVPVLAALAVLAAGWVFRLHEAQQVYRRGIETLRGFDQVHAEKSLLAGQLLPARSALKRGMADLQDARWRLAADEGVSDLLDQLANAAHAHGLLFEQLEVLEEVEAEDYRTTPLQLEVVGSYGALRGWLDQWLGQVRLLRPSSLQLAAVPGRQALLRFRLQVQTYHPGLRLPAALSLADDPARPATQAVHSDPFRPWSSAAGADGLARVPLAQLEMVGSLARDGDYQALLWSAGRLYRLGPGDRLGRDGGVVVRVDEHQLEVLERVFLGGAWQQRTTYLALRNRAGTGGMDVHQTAVGVGNGHVPVGPGGRRDRRRE